MEHQDTDAREQAVDDTLERLAAENDQLRATLDVFNMALAQVGRVVDQHTEAVNAMAARIEVLERLVGKHEERIEGDGMQDVVTFPARVVDE